MCDCVVDVDVDEVVVVLFVVFVCECVVMCVFVGMFCEEIEDVLGWWWYVYFEWWLCV